LADAVEKVGRESRRRNNRIERACNSNQRCAGDWVFESKLRGDALKIFFQHYRPDSDEPAAVKNVRLRLQTGLPSEE
jgi:hypothetical protein